jgi:hypothetical protein
MAACGGTRPSTEERLLRAARGTGDVVIAAAWPWEQRKEILYGEGLDMAVEEVNSGGGIGGRRLRVVRFDDHESVNGGLLAAQQIAADPDIVAVIGHLQSFVSVPAAAVYELSGLLMIAPTATDPELTSRGYRRVFRATSTDVEIGRLLADLAHRSGFRRVAIEYIRNAYGRGLANAIEERAADRNLVVTARQSYDPGEQVTERTFDATLRDWRNLELDAIFLAGEVPSAAFFIAEARAQGIRVPIFGGEALGTPALVLGIGYVGYGSLAQSHGFSAFDAVLSTACIWALPGQLILVEMQAGGAPFLAIVLAVVFSASRFLPMTVTLLPQMRSGDVPAWRYYVVSQLLSMTSWAVAMQRFPRLPQSSRLP